MNLEEAKKALDKVIDKARFHVYKARPSNRLKLVWL